MDFARIFRNSHADCMQILPCDQAIHIDFNIFELNHWLYCRTISKASDCLYDALFQRALCKCNTKQPFFCVTSMCQQYEAPWNAVCWNGELGEMHTQKKYNNYRMATQSQHYICIIVVMQPVFRQVKTKKEAPRTTTTTTHRFQYRIERNNK